MILTCLPDTVAIFYRSLAAVHMPYRFLAAMRASSIRRLSVVAAGDQAYRAQDDTGQTANIVRFEMPLTSTGPNEEEE